MPCRGSWAGGGDAEGLRGEWVPFESLGEGALSLLPKDVIWVGPRGECHTLTCFAAET